MSRRIVALAGLALALMALASPAAAQAEELFWWEDDMEEEIFLEEPKPAEPRAKLTFTVHIPPERKLVIGTCTAVANPWGGLLYNTETGEGKFYEGTFEAPCPTNEAGCTITVTPQFNWFLDLKEVGGKPKVNFTEVGLKFVPGAGCAGLPPEASAAGTVTGEFDNTDSRIVFTKAGGLTVGGLVQVEVDGEIRFGTKMTVK